jgi:diguanylate cyclase (GGDEF)-like protein
VPIVSRGGKVLVVDDVESNRELLRQELTERGFEVKTAAGGAEALVLSREFQPAVIILDINMPEMDGMETCRRLKADIVTAHIPVLFLTGQRADEDSSVEALAAGGNDFLQKPYVPAVLLARVNSQVAIHDAQARLRQMVMTDELTGVFSRRFLFESMRQQIKRLTAPAGPPSIACLMCDVDHFKKINDRFGHLEGDRVLRTVASILRTTVRAGDFVARFGGEEFVVVCPSTSIEDSLALAEKIRANVESGSREVIPVTISLGVACYVPVPGDAAADLEQKMDELFRLADEALYRAKDTGRNRVCQAA